VLRRLCQHGFTGQFDHGDRVLWRHVRKALEELVERIAGFDLVEQGLHRYTRSCERWRTAQKARVDRDQWMW
jgi:hypothetical protein